MSIDRRGPLAHEVDVLVKNLEMEQGNEKRLPKKRSFTEVDVFSSSSSADDDDPPLAKKVSHYLRSSLHAAVSCPVG